MKRLLFIPILALLIGFSQAADIFVDRTAGGDNSGSDWKNAYIFLQDGLGAASANDTIHIAEGTHYPDEGTGQSDDSLLSTFDIPAGVTLLGGYREGGSTRDSTQFITILTGDIDKNDDNIVAETPDDLNGTNALHVVTVSNTNATLDGLTITAGYALEGGTNQAFGGGLLITANGLEVRDCHFAGNRSRLRGGAIFGSDADPLIVNCSFAGNVSDDFGGAIATSEGAAPHFINCALFGNHADRGGAMHFDKSAPRITNCSISGNAATTSSGSVEAILNSALTIENTILWNNQAQGVVHLSSSALFSGSTSSGTTNLIQGNNSSDPQFLNPPDPADAPSAVGNLDVFYTSPAVDVGTNGLNSEPLDIAGDTRISDGNIDIGAYEQTRIFVDSTAVGTGDGSSWTDAFVELQDALAISTPGANIVIAAGTYYPDQGSAQSNNDRDSSFNIAGAVTMLGGYPAGGGSRDIAANPTILSGDLQQNDTNTDGNNIVEDVTQITGSNAYSVVTLASNSQVAMLSGLTITAGLADFLDEDNSTNQNVGAGIYSRESDLILEDSTLIGNQCSAAGGGLYFRGSGRELKATRCSFLSNAATSDSCCLTGAGLYSSAGQLLLSACHFEGNFLSGPEAIQLHGVAIRASGLGGANSCVIEDSVLVNNHNAGSTLPTRVVDIGFMQTATITRTNISGNDSGSNATTLSLNTVGSSTVQDCLFTGNRSGSSIALAIANSTQILFMINTTIARNSGSSSITASDFGDVFITLRNSFIDQPISTSGGVNVSRSHSLIAGQAADGAGNLPDTTDPAFVNPRAASEAPTTAGDYRLLSTSPLIDAGLNSATTSTVDLLGFTRIFDGDNTGGATIDLGAYEYDGTPDPIVPEIDITNIAFRDSDGRVTLTVQSDTTTTCTVQYSEDLSSWTGFRSGSLTPGTNTFFIPRDAYPFPTDAMWFRIVTP